MSNDYSVKKSNSPVIIPGLDNNNPCPSPLTWAESETIERTGTGAPCSPLRLEIKEAAFEKTPISVSGVGTLFSNDLLNGAGSAAGQNISGTNSMSILFGLNAASNANLVVLSQVLGLFAGKDSGMLINSVLLGSYAGQSASSLQTSIAIGNAALNGASSTIVNGVFIGANAGSGINGVDLFSNVIGIGNEAGSGLNATSSGNDSSILIGNAAGKNGTDFTSSIAIGLNAASPSWNTMRSTFIGENAGVNSWNNTNMVALGYNAGAGASQSFDVIAIGTNAGRDGFENPEEGDYSIQIGRNTSSSGKKNSVLLGGSTHVNNYISNTKDNQFMLAPNIFNLRWRGIDYELPESQAEDVALLANDGEGKLSWSSGYAMPLMISNRVPFVGVDGKLTTASTFTYSADFLRPPNIQINSGDIRVGNTTAARIAVAGATALKSSINIATALSAPTTPVTGDLWSNGSTLVFYNSGAAYPLTQNAATLTAGRVPFATTGGRLSDTANLVWDDTNGRLGVGIATPLNPLHVLGSQRLEAVGSINQSYTTDLPAVNRYRIKQNSNGSNFFTFELQPFADNQSGNFFVVQRTAAGQTNRFFRH